jgi:hypothetical protein
MDDCAIIRHPLDRFSFRGNMGHLDPQGRDSAERLMTMIGDMKFRKDNIEGTCARYFLLIDLSWFPQICFSAQINCAKLREYLWCVERGEEGPLENAVDDVQIALPFRGDEGQAADASGSSFEARWQVAHPMACRPAGGLNFHARSDNAIAPAERRVDLERPGRPWKL